MKAWINNLRGAAKCIAGTSPSPAVAEGRLAVCAACPSSNVYSSAVGGLLVCGRLGVDETDLPSPTCGCIVGACPPWTMSEIRAECKTPEKVRESVRLLVVPACKTDTRGERCPQGKWLAGTGKAGANAGAREHGAA